jgi:tRNA modification GTPase
MDDVAPVVTRARHRAALQRALDELDAFAAARGAALDAAVAATHLRDAVGALDELIGVVTPDDVLDRLFATFCVGK